MCAPGCQIHILSYEVLSPSLSFFQRSQVELKIFLLLLCLNHRLTVEGFVKSYVFGHKLGERFHSQGSIADVALSFRVLRLLFVQKFQLHALAQADLFGSSKVLHRIGLYHYFSM